MHTWQRLLELPIPIHSMQVLKPSHLVIYDARIKHSGNPPPKKKKLYMEKAISPTPGQGDSISHVSRWTQDFRMTVMMKATPAPICTATEAGFGDVQKLQGACIHTLCLTWWCRFQASNTIIIPHYSTDPVTYIMNNGDLFLYQLRFHSQETDSISLTIIVYTNSKYVGVTGHSPLDSASPVHCGDCLRSPCSVWQKTREKNWNRSISIYYMNGGKFGLFDGVAKINCKHKNSAREKISCKFDLFSVVMCLYHQHSQCYVNG